ncbi:DUF6036 family nucleotidyltransferase [Alkalihalophilus marmarensis]|uniref:DUF6036 family nucleotidyltransferase n=1 Tax=Alkalihalophilus marmarensis TaxID=521377 RepID=UPI002E1F6C1D|nr:nucleotidyltransferase [Alkalihalophilus marmarensis]
MDISQAIAELNKLNTKEKYEQMIETAAIITKLLEPEGIEPIVVGGLSVTIYTQADYMTRDIDFVSDGYEQVSKLLNALGFSKDNNSRHFYHSDLEVVIEIPDNYLDGDYDRLVKVELDNGRHVNLISIEDIIHDRLKAAVHWHNVEDREWGFKLLTGSYDTLDLDYLYNKLETLGEKIELDTWIDEIKSLQQS